MDKGLSLLKADFVEKKTGYPQLWRTPNGLFSERAAAKAEDRLVNTLKWNEVPSDSEHYDPRVEDGSLIDTRERPIAADRMRTNCAVH